MKENFKYLILTALLMSGVIVQAQQDARYSMYMFNGLAVNPAYAGSREGLSATLLLREQWVGIAGRPRTQSLTVHTPLMNQPASAFGFSLVNDQLGVTNHLNLLAAYAYRINLGDAGKLAFGLQGGFQNYHNRWGTADRIDQGDVIPTVNTNIWLPMVGTGVYYNSERFYAGAAVPNLVKNKYYRGGASQSDTSAKQVRHVFATAGFVIPLGESLDLKPSGLFKLSENAPVQIDLNLSLLIKKVFWLGGSFRPGESVVLMAEYSGKSGIRFGYAYDITLSKLRQVNSGSHEFMLGYDLFREGKMALTPRLF